jgi:hypothetical protein
MIDFLISINKISLIIFFLTLVILIYEYRLLKLESKKEKIPKIPQFNDAYASSFKKNENVVLVENRQERYKSHSTKFFIVLIIITLFFALASLVGFVFQGKTSNSTISNQLAITPLVEEKIVSSEGILIFDENFNLLKDEDLNKLEPQKKIIVGIKTLEGAEIDKARIRINRNIWRLEDETKKFENKNKVFYIEYEPASEESRLKIEAQLHSIKDGWLGE